MADSGETLVAEAMEIRTSGFADLAKPTEPFDDRSASLGQRNPQHYPHPKETVEVLGEPIPISEVAQMIGCSAWTVRQRLLPAGLPCFRIGRGGKLLFYRAQVIRWILARQQGQQPNPRGRR